ncbi:MAG: Hpt domain-containing protein [Rubripirellula sp.]
MIQKFAQDTREHLARIEIALHQIRTNDAAIDCDLVNTAMKWVRSIESSATLLGLDPIRSHSHRLECVLAAVRDNKLVPSSATVALMLKSAQQLRLQVDSLETSNPTNVNEFCSELDQLLAASTDPMNTPTPEPTAKRARRSAIPRAKGSTTGPRPKAKPSVAESIEGSLDQIIGLLDSATTDSVNELQDSTGTESKTGHDNIEDQS